MRVSGWMGGWVRVSGWFGEWPSLPQGWSVQFVTRHLGTERLPKGELVQFLQKRAKVSSGVTLPCPTLSPAPCPAPALPPGKLAPAVAAAW